MFQLHRDRLHAYKVAEDLDRIRSREPKVGQLYESFLGGIGSGSG